ncbi:MAG: hypothetical protein JWN70_2622 [Planctomycetaceae bacterium]|nr:hypothetical protein [Planctomycetaceae bacterium]
MPTPEYQTSELQSGKWYVSNFGLRHQAGSALTTDPGSTPGKVPAQYRIGGPFNTAGDARAWMNAGLGRSTGSTIWQHHE